MAECLRGYGVRTVNISLDTLDRAEYARTTGRDFLPQTLAGHRRPRARRVSAPNEIKLNCVLMRGRNEEQLVPLIEFAGEHGLLLRFIELMPVSTTDVLTEENFLPDRRGAPRRSRTHFGALMPDARVPHERPGQLLPGARHPSRRSASSAR